MRRISPPAGVVSVLLLLACCGSDPPTGGGGGGGSAGGVGGGATIADDLDGDGIANDVDPAPDDGGICGDTDDDGCDDCSVLDSSDPENDGWDADGDGACEHALDYACTHGSNAAADPWRKEACMVFALMNDDRALFDQESGGGAPLAWSEDLWEIAYAHSETMCARGIFDHVIDGDGPGDRASKAGLDFFVSENISANLDPSAAEHGFMNEPTCMGHRGNILDAGAIEVGVGYYVCDRDPEEYPWGEHHHITADFHTGGPSSSYCEDDATSCELPPDPPSTATCPPMLVEWGFCDPPSPGMLAEWSCPED